VSSAVGLLLEGGLFVLYIAAPLIAHRQDILLHDWNYSLDFRQSLSCALWLALLRGILFLYVIIATRHSPYPSTRCFVFLVVWSQLCILTVLSLLVHIFRVDDTSFTQYRKDTWSYTFWWSVVITSMASTIFQVLCVLGRNKERESSGNEEEQKIEKILREKEEHDLYEETQYTPLTMTSQLERSMHTLGKNLELAKWRSKWNKLVRKYNRSTDPTFTTILRVYAHKSDAMGLLEKLYDLDPMEFEFYIPQLCSFLLLGAFQQEQDADISMILLDKCKK